MNIVLVNGSPKFKNSVSGKILNSLKPCLQNNIIEEYVFRTNEVKIDDLKHLANCNAVVFAFPLYVDGIPSHFLRCLDQMEKHLRSNIINDIYVYTIVNIGFYEGKQASIAIEMMKNWAEKSNVKWGQGIGIGGGGMMSMIEKTAEGNGPMKNAYNALTSLANNILSRTSSEEIYTNPGIPRIVYKIGAEIGWRRTVKENGLKTKDLSLMR